MAGRIGTVEEWAKVHSITRRAAYKRIHEHQIPLRNGKLNFDEADRIWFAQFNPQKQRGGVAGGAAAASARSDSQGDLFTEPGEPADNGAPAPAMDGINGRMPTSALGRVQLLRDSAKAQYEKLRLDREMGKLVSLDEVTRFYGEVFSRLTDELSAIGAEVMDHLAESTDAVECREIVDRRIEKALRVMREWRPGTK